MVIFLKCPREDERRELRKKLLSVTLTSKKLFPTKKKKKGKKDFFFFFFKFSVLFLKIRCGCYFRHEKNCSLLCFHCAPSSYTDIFTSHLSVSVSK